MFDPVSKAPAVTFVAAKMVYGHLPSVSEMCYVRGGLIGRQRYEAEATFPEKGVVLWI